jgi:hypothetical protein
LRLAFGTLTILPVKPPAHVDRDTAGWAMTFAPLVGLVLAALVGVPLWFLSDAGAGSPFLLAALTIGALAWLTRAMHLDGLADVADGLGSGRRGEDALAIMKKSDIGPFGVATLLLVLLIQVTALATCIQAGFGATAVLVGVVLRRPRTSTPTSAPSSTMVGAAPGRCPCFSVGEKVPEVTSPSGTSGTSSPHAGPRDAAAGGDQAAQAAASGPPPSRRAARRGPRTPASSSRPPSRAGLHRRDVEARCPGRAAGSPSRCAACRGRRAAGQMPNSSPAASSASHSSPARAGARSARSRARRCSRCGRRHTDAGRLEVGLDERHVVVPDRQADGGEHLVGLGPCTASTRSLVCRS